MATADLGEDSLDVGVGDRAVKAVMAALRSLGESYASEMASGMYSDRKPACYTKANVLVR